MLNGRTISRGMLILTLVLPTVFGRSVPAAGGTTYTYDGKASCRPTGFFRDGRDLTAAQIGGDVSGTLDASPCDIGVYYGIGASGNVSAIIFSALYFGVVADGAVVQVTHSEIGNIGNRPFDGTQHGVAVYYTNGASGTIDSNSVRDYQKGGIVVNGTATDGTATTATVTNNDVGGLGPVEFIAQNGIQISRGAVATVRGNDIADNFYTGTAGVGPNPGGQNPPGWQYVSTGLLLFEAGAGTFTAENHFSANQLNKAVVP